MLVNPNASVFGEQRVKKINVDKKYIFVSDNFLDSPENLYVNVLKVYNLSNSKNEIELVSTSQITKDFITENKDKFFIFGGLDTINWKYVPDIMNLINFSIFETEFKFCKYKSPYKHKINEKKECDCHSQQIGKVVDEFYSSADSIFWLTERQRSEFVKNLDKMKNYSNNFFISQIFDLDDLNLFESLKTQEKNDKYAILNTNNILDGTMDSIKYANENQIKFDIINRNDYKDNKKLYETLSKYNGIIYTPLSEEHEPRFLSAAKLFGSNIKLNTSVHFCESAQKYEETIKTISWSLSKKETVVKISGYSVFTEKNINHLNDFTLTFKDICDEIYIAILNVSSNHDLIEQEGINYVKIDDQSQTVQTVKDIIRKTLNNNFILELEPEYRLEKNFKDLLNQTIKDFPKRADFFCLPILTKNSKGDFTQNNKLKYWREILSKNVDKQIKHKNDSYIYDQNINQLSAFIDTDQTNVNIFVDLSQNLKVYDHIFYELDINKYDNYTIFNMLCQTLIKKFPTIYVVE